MAFKLYPDIRRIINYLQSSCASGKLVVNEDTINDSEKESLLKELINEVVKTNDLLNVRRLYLSKKDKIIDYVAFASEVFNYVVDSQLVVDADGILKLSDMMYYMNVVIDKESMFFGMLTAISKYRRTIR